jgi:hypothetical protein
MFTPSSRYYSLETATIELPDGRQVAYKRRRFLPRGSEMPLLVETAVQQSDRLDLITHRILGDSLHFWRICDANDAMDPLELTEEVGRLLRIPVPQP